MQTGSPIWQGGLMLFAVLFLLFEIWRGWRAGIARAGINVAAAILSTLVCLFAGDLAAKPFGGVKEAGGFVAASIVGGGLGIFVFLLLWLSGLIFFKRTAHQGSGLIRFFWGSGGAFFGLLMGIFLLWGGISLIRGMGTLAEARVEIAQGGSAAAAQPGTPHAAPPAPAFAANVVKLKQSLELGPAGKFVESVDMVPSDYYELIMQVAVLAGDQQALLRLLEYPGMQEVVHSPRMTELVSDPGIIRAAEDRNIAALIANPKLLAAVRDPVLLEQLEKIDLRAAMKFAVQKPSPAPATETK